MRNLGRLSVILVWTLVLMGMDIIAPRPTNRTMEPPASKNPNCQEALYNEIPSSALVWENGEYRITSFDEGWAMYVNKGPGKLVKVCA